MAHVGAGDPRLDLTCRRARGRRSAAQHNQDPRPLGHGITIVFAIEYLLRLRLASDRRVFARSHLFDLLVILPVFPPLRIVRSVRILRTMRVARAAALVGKGVRESRHVYRLRDIPRVLVVSGLLVLAAAGLVSGVERQDASANITTFSDAFWWAVATASTVGSKYEPVTPEGRLIAVGLMVLGISVVTAMAGIFAADFVQRCREAPASGNRI